jgi:5-methylcytosine-specific restriction endonuclease McrA
MAAYREANSDKIKAGLKAYYEANREKAKAYREANSDKIKAMNKAWREANREKEKARGKAYREANPEKRKAGYKAWYEANPDKAKAKDKAWYEANRDKVKARDKAYREANADKVKAGKRAWREANPEKARVQGQRRRARKAALPSTFTAKQWKVAKAYFDNQCAYCDKPLKRVHQEHFIPLSKGGGYTRRNIVPSCPSCNLSKNNHDPLDWLIMRPNGLVVYVRVTQYLER